MKATFLSVLILAALFSPSTFGRSSIRRVDGELIALLAALESYKEDHGHYPSDIWTTERLKPNSTFDPGLYMAASRFLYRELSGDADGDPTTSSPKDKKRYFPFKPGMLRFLGSRRNTYIVDPWGNSYGYSTFRSVTPRHPGGNNSTFDLWSTGGGVTSKDRKMWVTNW